MFLSHRPAPPLASYVGALLYYDVALAGGYCDQAHLAHEFRDFSGISPGSYLVAERPFVNHVHMD